MFRSGDMPMTTGLLSAVAKVDRTFIVIFGVSGAILVLITAVMIFFTVRYRRARHPVPTPIVGHWLLEVVWTVIPTVIVLILFWYGWDSYRALRDGPLDAMPVEVVARQYAWSFQYPDGRGHANLIVPVGRPVQLTLKSLDVIHGLFIPAFRLKRDIVPGMPTKAWFAPDAEGAFEIFCSQYCGAKHFAMRAELVIVSNTLFEAWRAGQVDTAELMAGVHHREWADAPPGLRVLKRYGCLNCHSIDGSRDVGPTFKGLFGSEVVVVHEGRRMKMTADAEYVKRAITDPRVDIVVGCDALMSPYDLTVEEMAELLAYLKEMGVDD